MSWRRVALGSWAPAKALNTGSNDIFAQSVSVSDGTVVVGAWSEDSGATGVNGDQSDNGTIDAGAVYVFIRSGTTWSQEAYLKASNAGAVDRFGYCVSVAGDAIVVGAYREDSRDGNPSDNGALSSGAAYVCDLDTPLGLPYCTPAVPNSGGQPGVVAVHGSAVVSDDDLTLFATDLPTDSNLGYFIMGTGTNAFVPLGSAGPICVAPGIQRFLMPVNNTNELPGGFSRVVGTAGPVSGNITAGSTWNFQAWHRDFAAGASNLTDAVSVTFN